MIDFVKMLEQEPDFEAYCTEFMVEAIKLPLLKDMLQMMYSFWSSGIYTEQALVMLSTVNTLNDIAKNKYEGKQTDA
jgi:hypothetical protein